jgi:type I restriction-modification system DNA methylase subunit
LKDLAEFYELKVVKKVKFAIPKLYPDEIMVYRLRSAVETVYIPMFDALKKKVGEHPDFLSKIYDWFVKQGWIITGGDEDFEKVARQAAYLLINKILFYNVLRSRNPILKSLSLEHVMYGEEAEEELRKYFQSGANMGYGVIFASDFLEKVPIPDEALPTLKSLVNELNKYDFSKIGYDIIGKIFEKLIPKDERHVLGQYFTSNDVVDVILGFCVRDANPKVLDPACGSGTFLVRAYVRKRHLAKREGILKEHDDLLKEIWGVDISKFPATLSIMNLIIRDLEAEENIPKIFCRDFFSLEPGRKEKLFEFSEDYKKMKKMEEYSEFELPQFDAIVANPPYTRQEEMEDVMEEGYKERLRALMKQYLGINIGKRSSIYAYFLLYPYIFLKDGGRMGQITSNSWLDVDYGKYLQEFFLKHYKIVAIIESKVERWFEDADVNTAITILEKCSDEEERNNNLVKFVQIKVPLRQLIPEVLEDVSEEEKWREEEIRWKAIEELVNLIEKVKETYEDDKIRIYVKRQIELLDEGLDEEGKYVGAKWGKYIRVCSFL